jgi:hypothetical protein
MLVFFEQRLAFLATPKTGSTAIAAALESLAAVSIQRPPLLKHTTVHRYRRFIGPFLEAASKDSFTLVALMREPMDWLGSWYRFRQREETEPGKSTRGMSFDALRAGLVPKPAARFRGCGQPGPVPAAAAGSGGGPALPLRGDRRLRAFPGGAAGLRDHPAPPERLAPRRCELSAETEAMLREVAAEDFALHASLTPRRGLAGRGFRA